MDWSKEVLRDVERIYNQGQRVFACKERPDESDKNRYDIVGAYSVLEHAQDDEAMLREWIGYLKDGGRLILSVPAHMKYWTHVDEIGGHYRRYEKAGLLALMEKCGLEDIHVISMGYPFLVMALPLTSRVRGKEVKGFTDASSKEERTKATGRIFTSVYKLRRFVPFRLIAALARAQRMFYDTDHAYDYTITARKPAAPPRHGA